MPVCCAGIEQLTKKTVTAHKKDKIVSDLPIPKAAPTQPAIYQIRLEDRLGPQWTAWFADMTVTPGDNGETLLTGPVVDQAALHGLLRKVRDLGLPLLAVTRIIPGQADGLVINSLQ